MKDTGDTSPKNTGVRSSYPAHEQHPGADERRPPSTNEWLNQDENHPNLQYTIDAARYPTFDRVLHAISLGMVQHWIDSNPTATPALHRLFGPCCTPQELAEHCARALDWFSLQYMASGRGPVRVTGLHPDALPRPPLPGLIALSLCLPAISQFITPAQQQGSCP